MKKIAALTALTVSLLASQTSMAAEKEYPWEAVTSAVSVCTGITGFAMEALSDFDGGLSLKQVTANAEKRYARDVERESPYTKLYINANRLQSVVQQMEADSADSKKTAHGNRKILARRMPTARENYQKNCVADFTVHFASAERID